MRTPRPHFSKTLLFVLALGLAFSAVGLTVALAEDSADGHEYRAVEFDPATEPEVLADASNDVMDTKNWPEDEMDHDLIDDAIADGPITSEDPPRGIVRLAEKRYAVHDGTYYRIDGRVDGPDDRERVELDLERRSPDAVVDDVAVPYESADADVRQIVDDGNGTTAIGAPSVVERDGRYYALEIEPDQILLLIASLVVGTTLERVGHAYLGVALGVLGATAVVGRRRALDRRGSLAVAAVAIPVHVALSGARNPGFDLGHVFVSVLTAGTVVGLALVVGVGAAMRSQRRLRDASLLIALILVVVVGSASASHWDVSMTSLASVVTPSVFAFLVVGTFGVPLAILGFVHAHPPQSDETTRNADGELA